MCDVKVLYKSDFLLMAEYEMHCVKMHCLRCTKLTQYKERPRLQAGFWKERDILPLPKKNMRGLFTHIVSACLSYFASLKALIRVTGFRGGSIRVKASHLLKGPLLEVNCLPKRGFCARNLNSLLKYL